MKNKKQRNKPQSVQTTDQAYEAILQNREKLVAAWVAATGIHPEKCMLVERRYADGTVGVFARRLTEEDNQRLCPQCGCSLTKQ